MDQESHLIRSGLRTAFVLVIAFAIVPVRATGEIIPFSNEGKMPVVVVQRENLRSAMAEELQQGYDPTATTNSGRFFAEVVFSLVREAKSHDPEGRLLLIQHQDWFRAFLDVNGLSEEEAPLGSWLAFQNKQDVFIDYRDTNIVKVLGNNPSPRLALNVQISWPKSPDVPDKYSFEDTLSTPRLKVTNQRIIRFRLLDFGDMIAYDEIEGITGRPVSGLLAPLFFLIGEGRLVWARMAVAEDGLQIGCARAQKGFFSVTETVTVQPDGVAKKGLPGDSPELVALAERLKDDIEIEYGEWSMPDSALE